MSTLAAPAHTRTLRPPLAILAALGVVPGLYLGLGPFCGKDSP